MCMATLVDLWTLTFWEAKDSPTDPQKVKLFSGGPTATKQWTVLLDMCAESVHLFGVRAIPLTGDCESESFLQVSWGPGPQGKLCGCFVRVPCVFRGVINVWANLPYPERFVAVLLSFWTPFKADPRRAHLWHNSQVEIRAVSDVC